MNIYISIILVFFNGFVYGQENPPFRGEICYEYQTDYISIGDQPIPPSLLLLSEPKIKCFLFNGSDTIISYIIVSEDTVNISKHAEGFHETYFARKGLTVDFSALSSKSRTKSKTKIVERNVTYKGYSADKVVIKRSTGDISHSIIANDLSLNIKYKEAKAAGLSIHKKGLTLLDSTYSQITPDLHLEKKTELLYINENYDFSTHIFTSFTPDEKYKPIVSSQKNVVSIPNELREHFEFKGLDKNKEIVDPNIFKGSYSYVALWASWCEPCIRSIAFLSDLNSDYTFKDINIISLSVDDEKDFDKWTRKSDSEYISWSNYLLDKGMKSSSCLQLGVKVIPYYFIIDPNGKIMLENAPSPSDPNLKQVFSDILKSN